MEIARARTYTMNKGAVVVCFCCRTPMNEQLIQAEGVCRECLEAAAQDLQDREQWLADREAEEREARRLRRAFYHRAMRRLLGL